MPGTYQELHGCEFPSFFLFDDLTCSVLQLNEKTGLGVKEIEGILVFLLPYCVIWTSHPPSLGLSRLWWMR